MTRLLLPVIVLAACADGPTAVLTESPPREARVEPLFGTQYSNVRDQRRMLITDQETWAALWAEMLPSIGGPATPPYVDFSKEVVLVAAMGERRGAGFGIAITAVTSVQAELRIEVTSTLPALSCNGADVITTPLAAVRVPRTTSAIEFAERSIVLSCT